MSILDPLGRWRSDGARASLWKAMVDTDEFRAGLNAAILELQSELCNMPSGAEMLRGVNKLAIRLCNMHEPPTVVKAARYDLPNPQAGT